MEVTRRRSDFSSEVRQHAFGTQDVLLQTREAELSVYRVTPGQACEFPAPNHRTLYLLLGGSLRGETSCLLPWRPQTEPLAEPRLRCTSEDPARVLCCTTLSEID